MAQRTPAEQLAATLPWTAGNIRRIAAAYLADPAYGELPADFTYLVLTQGELDGDAADSLLAELEQAPRAR